MTTHMDVNLLNTISIAREKLIVEVVNYFSTEPAVIGVFMSGSLPAGTADSVF